MTVRPEIASVFTPRKAEINNDMYIDRPSLERALLRAVRGSMHSLLFGESGNGKSWLYKRVMERNSIPYVVANCANASRNESITKEICDRVIASGTATKTGYSEDKSASVKAVVLEGGVKHQSQYLIRSPEPLLSAFKSLFQKSPNGSIVVLDNLESIFFDSKLMDELADIIILLDDEEYAACKVKFLIVGVPNGVLEYFSRSKNLESVSNRIEEIQKIDGFDLPQVTELVKKGFVDQLQLPLTLTHQSEISRRIFHVTMGVAQRVHEYCEKLAYNVEENNWVYKTGLLELAEKDWLMVGLRQSYSVVEGHLNSRATSIARRNQVIFGIGRITSHQFDSARIEDIIRKEFPETIPETNMGIGSILSELANSDSPLLKKNDKTNEYSIADPRYVMCIRVVLQKDKSNGKVVKRQFKQ